MRQRAFEKLDVITRKWRSFQINRLRSVWSGRGACVGEYRALFENKYLFSAWLRGLGASVPRDLGVVMRVNGGWPDSKEMEVAVRGEGVAIGKPVSGNQGRGVHVFEWSDGGFWVDGTRLSSSLGEFVARECEVCGEPYGYLFQEKVTQHPALSSSFGKALHTVRVITVQTPDGPRVFDALIRVARKDSHVDNFSAGGMVAHVDTSSWTVDSKFGAKSGVQADEHPDTGAKAQGFALPFRQDISSMVESLHALVPTVGAVGWDIGLTTDGPTVVEGNLSMDVQMQSQVFPGDFRAEFLKALRVARRSTRAIRKLGGKK